MIILNNKALRKRSNNTETFQRADGGENQQGMGCEWTFEQNVEKVVGIFGNSRYRVRSLIDD
ncbi:hypothetical protein GCM10011573_21840 [Enterococcus wangshanyuanii]|uniref:Uncharacterized protein n=1 Tax=Enterococcus wangshanyuanii TaxID=2005703 RepID=A0ABQ1P6J0_9ENTE|nr:hypothetical protein GCM10011573_21840 [Enterococcus wangshanyuanii]